MQSLDGRLTVLTTNIFHAVKHINEINIDRHLHIQDDCRKILHDYDTAKTFFSAFGSFARDDFSQTTIMRDALRKLQVAVVYCKLTCCCADYIIDNLLFNVVQGPLAFVLYDEKEKRIVASRDKDGKEPLFWGTNAVGDLLMFSTDQLALCDSCEYVSEFPSRFPMTSYGNVLP